VELPFTCSGEPSEIDGSSREDSTALVIKEYVRAGAFDVVERRKTDDANGKVPVTDGFHDRVTVPEISSKGNWRRKTSLPRKPLLAIPVEIVEVERCIDNSFMRNLTAILDKNNFFSRVGNSPECKATSSLNS
jgi:hypothetical protein